MRNAPLPDVPDEFRLLRGVTDDLGELHVTKKDHVPMCSSDPAHFLPRHVGMERIPRSF